MLYPKNRDKELSLELFKNPTCEYPGTPFWAWNCELEEEELLWQIDTLREMGFGGFHMHVRNGMKTEYMGEKFMDLVASCVNKAKRDNMLAWLYDEDRWPSGFAGGLVTKELKYRKRILLMTVNRFNGESEDGVYLAYSVKDQVKRMAFKENTVLLRRFAVVLNADGSLKSYRTLADGEETAEGTGLVCVSFLGTRQPEIQPRELRKHTRQEGNRTLYRGHARGIQKEGRSRIWQAKTDFLHPTWSSIGHTSSLCSSTSEPATAKR